MHLSLCEELLIFFDFAKKQLQGVDISPVNVVNVHCYDLKEREVVQEIVLLILVDFQDETG